MEKCCIYKVKEESKKLFPETIISEYVVVTDFAMNPLNKEVDVTCLFKHIFIETLGYTDTITGYRMLSSKEFEKHFDLYMNQHEINEKLRELEFEKLEELGLEKIEEKFWTYNI